MSLGRLRYLGGRLVRLICMIRTRSVNDRAGVIDLAHRRVPQVPAHRVAGLLDAADLTFRVDVVGEQDAALVGWASTVERAELPSLLFGRIVVAPERERQGLGSQLHARLLTDLPSEVTFLRGVVIDSDVRALEVVAHWGYEPYELCHVSRFALQDLPEPRTLSGVSFEPCPALRFPDEDAVTAMLDRAETNPERAHGMFLNLPMLRSFAAPGEPLGFLARVAGDPVGLVHGYTHGEQLLISLLCIDPAFRGRGIALALKERLHWTGRQLGATHVLTGNEDTNTPVRTLNARLGYRRLHGEVRVQRPLR